jgi:ATP-dependent Clp protease adaptor protein ClpS
MSDAKRQGGVLERTRPSAVQPRMYRVVLHNDDYTTMEFVVDVLETIFERSPAEAHGIMMRVHAQGSGVAGTYPFEVAETKVGLVHDRASVAGYPLRASVEDA